MGGQGPDTADEQPPHWWTPVLAVLLVASIALAGIALAIPLADLDVDTRVGIIDFKLDTDWNVGKVTYTGSAADFGVDVEGEQVLLEGTGDFQEAVGFLKGTSKSVTNFIEPYTTGAQGIRGTAQVNVTVSTETIPWWVVGIATPTTVEVELVETVNMSSLQVDRVYLEFRREVEGQILSKEVWSKKVNDPLEKVGDKRSYSTDLEISEDWGEFMVFGMVEVTMVDVDGVTALPENVFRSYSTEPKVITLWSISTGQGVKIAMVIVAMPVFIVGIIMAALAIVTVLRKGKGRLVLPIGAGVLLILGAIFFNLGTSELADLVGYPDDMEYRAGYYIMLAAFAPATIAGVLIGYEGTRWKAVEEDAEEEVVEEETQAPLEGGTEVPSAENNITDEDPMSEEGEQ
jgi:hypothetical protein